MNHATQVDALSLSRNFVHTPVIKGISNAALVNRNPQALCDFPVVPNLLCSPIQRPRLR